MRASPTFPEGAAHDANVLDTAPIHVGAGAQASALRTAITFGHNRLPGCIVRPVAQRVFVLALRGPTTSITKSVW